MPRPDLFRSSTSQPNSATVLEFDGELDVAVVPLLRSAVHTAWSTSPDVEIDMSGTTFLDCSALGALIGLAHESQAAGCSVRLRDVPEQVGWIVRHFDLVGLLLGELPSPAGSSEQGVR